MQVAQLTRLYFKSVSVQKALIYRFHRYFYGSSDQTVLLSNAQNKRIELLAGEL
jgi:hypothetical protein